MDFEVVTIFPEMVDAAARHGVTGRALERGVWQLRCHNPRDHAHDAYRRIDDRPFGGGPGMVMLAEPLHRCIEAIRADRPVGDPARLIHFTPTGQPLTQALVRELAAGPGALLLCGRYEGVDQRVLDKHQALDISIGDFVLSGGDLPALLLIDAVARLQPGVLHDPASHEQDSFEGDGLLEGPHYSRPEVWPEAAPSEGAPWHDGEPVPPVLLSGHHADIQRWRRARSLEITARRRPDLIEAARAAGRLSREDEQVLAALYNGGF